MKKRSIVLSLSGFLFLASSARADSYLLPDLITLEAYLQDYKIQMLEGRKTLRFSNATANIGKGKLELRGHNLREDESVEAYQRIYARRGIGTHVMAGLFEFYQDHLQTQFSDYTHYRLKNSEGDIVAQGTPQGACMRDSAIYSYRLLRSRPWKKYTTCGTGIQGLSAGWLNIQSKDLQAQYLDITGLPSGKYWLESEVDPSNRIRESDETNNAAKIEIFIP